ncbi:MAG TPA: hypothetical protein VHG28_02005 [Longimicrobiaceae bacterium]|nr:hypothetical protein [Longimicrobiaceae bacterium]
MLPDRLFARALVARSARLWLGVRVMLMASVAAARLPPLAPGAVLSIVAVVAGIALGYLEARRRNELLLLAELGTHPGTIALLVCAPVLLLELCAAGVVLWIRS